MNTINTNGFNAVNQTGFAKPQSSAVYAEKGDVIYQKDMDKDDDGVITFQEFTDYCDENDISYAERKQMLQNRLELQLHKDRARVSAEIKKIESDKNALYAKEGDEKYDKEMDKDGDGKVTYDEYMRYCQEQEEAQENKQPEKAELEKKEDDKVVVKNEGKAINKYAKAETEEPESKVEKEG